MESYLTAEISADAVLHNLALLRQGLSPGTKLCAVVKADCYGHGLDLLLPVISRQADCVGTTTPEEAIHLRDQLKYPGPILMFFSACAYRDGLELHDALRELIARQVTLTVVSPAEVLAIAEAARHVNVQARVHIKIDTGMGRSGMPFGQVGELADACRRAEFVKLAGMYTHFATADGPDKALAMEQLRRFLSAADGAGGREGLTLHAANSAGTIDLPATHLDMVRPGIAMYGYQPSDDMHTRLPLQPALRLWGRLMQIKDIPSGSSCGYGLTYVFRRDSRVGLVPVGYGDGYFRSLSNRSSMRIRGRDVPIRGRVSMDQIIIDLTDVPQAQIGDEVEIISPNPTAPHSVETLARHADTIPYEITCRLGRRVRRVLV